MDDHLIAGLGADGRLTVKTLPFGLSTAHRPRLLAGLNTAAFTPSDRHIWRPQFDVSKPVDHVRLIIRYRGHVVRTLTGTGDTGSIRNLHWNGKTQAGQELPAGAYEWTLNATAQDGEGTLTGADGRHPASGTLSLNR